MQFIWTFSDRNRHYSSEFAQFPFSTSKSTPAISTGSYFLKVTSLKVGTKCEDISLPGCMSLGELNISRNLTNLNIDRMKTLCPEMKRSRSALFEINPEKNLRGPENLQNSLFRVFRKTPNLRK